MGDKRLVILGGQTGYWGTNRLPLLVDKHIALIEGNNQIFQIVLTCLYDEDY